MPYRKVEFAQYQYYHIYNRGAGRQAIFHEDENYLYLLRLVQKYVRALQVTVIAYCLMPNHYHFLLRQDGLEAAGLLPQRVFNGYSKAFNKRYGRTGTLFEDRFEAIHVDKEAYLIHLCRYIHANPVKHGLVAMVAEWPYSNYHEWIGKRPGTLVDMEFVRAYFPSPEIYEELVLDYVRELDKLPAGMKAYLPEWG